MKSNTLGVSHFTADNIVAVLRAIPDSKGTYADVAANARHQGATVGQHTVAKWVTQGRRDIDAQKDTSFARFTKQYESLLKEHCGPETNRCREFDRALLIMERICECGNQKQLAPDGTVDDQCRNCQDLDQSQHQRNGQRPVPNVAEGGSMRRGPKAQ